MISQPDQDWCPNCQSKKYSFETFENSHCKECGAAVVEDWPLWARARRRALQVVAVVIIGAVLLGPPALAVWRAVTYEGPLYATRTVTTTEVQHYGLVLDVGSALIPWLAIVLMLVAIPAMPRRI